MDEPQIYFIIYHMRPTVKGKLFNSIAQCALMAWILASSKEEADRIFFDELLDAWRELEVVKRVHCDVLDLDNITEQEEDWHQPEHLETARELGSCYMLCHSTKYPVCFTHYKLRPKPGFLAPAETVFAKVWLAGTTLCDPEGVDFAREFWDEERLKQVDAFAADRFKAGYEIEGVVEISPLSVEIVEMLDDEHRIFFDLALEEGSSIVMNYVDLFEQDDNGINGGIVDDSGGAKES